MSIPVTNSIKTKITQLQNIENLIKAGTWILNIQEDSLYWSDGVYLMLGYPAQAFTLNFEVGTNIIHPDDREKSLQHMQETLQNGSEYNITKRLRNARGHYLLVQSKATLLKDDFGKPVQLIGVFHDITEFVEISRQLEEAKHTSHLLLENADGIFWEANPANFEFSYISPQVESITGYTQEEWLSDPEFWQNHLHPEDREYAIEFCKRETSALNNHVFDYRLKTKSGSYIWIHDRVKVISKEDHPVKLTGLMLDVTADFFYNELDKIEKKLLQSAIRQDVRLYDIISAYLLDLEKLFPDMKGTVMKTKFGKLYMVAAPSIPSSYSKTIEGLVIGLNQGSCGTAAFTGKNVIVGNVYEDDRWKNFIHLPKEFGFKACWSLPIINEKNEVVATMAFYYPYAKLPGSFEEFAIERSKNLLSLVITKFDYLDNLKISNERFQLVNRGTKDAIYDLDIEKDQLIFGEGYGKQFGYEEVVKKPLKRYDWIEKIHPADQLQISTSLDHFIQTSEEERWESAYQFRKKDGTYAHVEEIGHIVRDTNGKPVRMVGVIRDVTETRELQKLLDTATKLAIVGGWELNFSNIEQPVFTCSEITRQILQVHQDEAPDWQSFVEMADGLAKNQLELSIRKLMTSGIEFDLELPLFINQQHERWVRIIGQSEFIDNTCSRIFGSIQDIHEKKTNELELSKKNRLLDTLSLIISVFLKADDWITVLPGIFSITGRTAEVDRVYYFDLHMESGTGRTLASQRYEWTREEITPEIDNPELQNVPVLQFPSFFEPLLKGSPVQLVASQLQEKELKRIFTSQNIKSCLALPVMVENNCVGIIGFDDCRAERYWNESEISFLINITVNLAAAYHRKNNQLKLESALFERNTILESIGDGFCAINGEGNITYWNKQAEEIFNLPRIQVEDRPAKAVFAEVFQVSGSHEVLSILDSEEKKSVEFHNIQTSQWFDIVLYPAGNGNSVFIRDITNRKQTEAQIQQSNERFEIITRATNDAIWDYDFDQDKLFWGQGFSTLFGYNLNEIEPSFQLLLNLIHPEDQPNVVKKIQTYMNGSSNTTIWEEEYKFRKANGEYSYVVDKAIFIKDEKGKVIRALGAMSDISHRKEYEASLKNLNLELEKKVKELANSNMELEQFAYVASHDLQEPLRMVTGFLTQLEKKYTGFLDDKAQQYIYYATDGAKRMRQIILDLLDFSRIGKQKEKLVSINLNRLMEEIISLNINLLEEKKAALEYIELPVILSYHSPLLQVFQNLVTNAIKYSNAAIPPQVRISATDLGNDWEFAVADNGIGIPREYHERIFIIFQRLHKRDEYSGTGIGLAVVKKIIENMGGTIRVSSEPGKGSTFYFTVPKYPNEV